jgi:hypothetical protein
MVYNSRFSQKVYERHDNPEMPIQFPTLQLREGGRKWLAAQTRQNLELATLSLKTLYLCR